MLKVVRYVDGDEEKVVALIRKVQEDAEPSKHILSRSVLIKDDHQIVGMVSYEPYSDMGVIRYFLYDARITGVDITVKLFLELYKKAHSEGVKQLIAQMFNCEVRALFELLGFIEVSTDLSNLSPVISKDALIMMINLEEEGK